MAPKRVKALNDSIPTNPLRNLPPISGEDAIAIRVHYIQHCEAYDCMDILPVLRHLLLCSVPLFSF